MSRFWNRWAGTSQTPKQNAPRCKHGRKRVATKRVAIQRRLKPETLEIRQLLAANIFHNELMPEDVNQDGIVSAIDALTIINEMNRQDRGDSIVDGVDEQRRRGLMTDVNNDGRSSAVDALRVINRLNRERDGIADPSNRPGDPPVDDQSSDVRTIDGSGNNLENPDLGSTGTELLRAAENDYADGVSVPAGQDRPSAREISNALSAADPNGITSERNLSSFVSAWGQFLDHDIDLSLEPTDEADGVAFDIEVPAGDPLFDPFNTGEETIHLTRSVTASGTGTSIDNPAEQVNAITAWVDGSQVYGSDQETSDALREFVGGRLLISDEGLLPTDEEGDLLAGDIRAAENVVLTSMHALFVREHNRLADTIATANGSLTDEQVFQQARAILIAEMQSITYNEYLPALLGEDALTDYAGYDSSVDPSIANEFSTAAFRFGHSTLNDEFRLVANDGTDVEDPVSLANAFFQPELLEETGIDPFLKYASSTLSQETDLEVVDSLRNFLFGPPGSGGLDLVSLNIQRGRDHGLADYNSTRQAYGLDAAESFADITSDVEVQMKLEALYGDVNDIDLWVGLMAEDHTQNGSLGETATTIIADQFERLRDGDRFYYANALSVREIRQIENTTLADIIERNTSLDSLQENVFFFAPKISGRAVADAGGNRQNLSGSPDVFALGNLAPGAVEQTDLDLLARDQMRLINQGRPNSNGRDRISNSASETVEGLTVELIDSDGNLVDSVTTDRSGKYVFINMDESGAYTVRLIAVTGMEVLGPDRWDVLVNNSDIENAVSSFRVRV